MLDVDFRDMDEALVILRLSPELMLKSAPVRRQFQDVLRRNLKTLLSREGVSFDLDQSRGRMLLRVPAAQQARVLDLLPKVFGLGGFSPVERVVPADLEVIKTACRETFGARLRGHTYAVRAKRTGPRTLSTRDLEIQVGAALNEFATVNLNRPDITVRIDVAGDRAYLYTDRMEGAGGLPAGTQGKVAVLVSGGFDSVVAAWQLMKRGADVEFVFCNLGGSAYERLVLQVVKVLCHLWAAGLRPHLHVVDFEGILAEIRGNTRTRFWQIILKRMMYQVANRIAAETGAQAIVTGEALGQVSSQTLSNLHTIDAASKLPVLRPLIGFDKRDIMVLARHVGTAPLSERIPEHCSISHGSPAVKSRLSVIEEMEAAMDISVLEAAVHNRKIIDVDAVTAADLRTPYLWVEAVPETAELIDCQPEEYYRGWHVKDVRHYTVDDLPRLFRELPKDQTYVLYCAHGVQSALMAEHMQQRGYDAYAFRGGLQALKEELRRLGRAA